MHAHFRLEGPVEVLSVAGEVDERYAHIFRSLLQGKLAERCPALVVDLREVDFISSRGLGALLEYQRDSQEAGLEFAIGEVREHLKEVFALVQLDRHIPCFLTVQEAVATLAGRIGPGGNSPVNADAGSAPQRTGEPAA